MSAALASFHADFTPFGARSLLTLFVSAQAGHRARGLGRAMLTPADVAGLAGCRVAAARDVMSGARRRVAADDLDRLAGFCGLTYGDFQERARHWSQGGAGDAAA
ncbi:hypothetical protein [Pannonibacter sp. SL95]|uniref:hypothetical protein n=1 Tax=Pannonibacter sp. SL95 TaxID=2995153 RepID=UPI002272A089|nr:hypothetical protein [Pannonibacter sp. SL95]MCY1709034.1 hypothetical protein [Pannonibacter sp. SL95]